MDQTTRTHFLKKSIPILVSVSAFSIMFSFSFLLENVFPHKMRGYITDRNYIFLFFNGVLVLIIASSGLASNPWSSSETKHEFVGKRVDQAQPVVELTKHGANHREVVIVESEEQMSEFEDSSEVEDDENEFFEIEEEGFGVLSTEELNKKCDDFIRKVRDEIKFQAY